MSEVPNSVDRRTFLGALASLSGTAVAGCSALEPESDAKTSPVDDETAREFATTFAPRMYFDVNEPWFPTDPRPYVSEQDGETVVDGFDALNGYHDQYSQGDPPDPTVFYHALTYDNTTLAVVQFWFYSVFDQFTTNFHWHDWEVLHVFFDIETDAPQLFVASSHSRKVPNNEFLDPDPAVIPRVLSELGSHSSTLSVNEVHEHFQRVGVDDLLADITNTAIEGVETLANLPIAYGLPRDEGFRLPFLVPEYEDVPLYEHERLPSVTRESLIDAELTIRSYDAVISPQTDLPERESGIVFGHTGQAGDADIEYDLVSSDELDDITSFTGPQLSFEFSVPDVVEDAIAGHITTTGTPKDQARYDNPAADITTRKHRAALADRYDAVGKPSSINSIATQITEAITSDEAPENEGLTTTDSAVESVVLLESEPEAVPTFGGIAVVQDVPSGDHRLAVNGAGRAPHSEQVAVAEDEGTTIAGVGSEIPLVANEHARKVAVQGENAAIDLSTVAVEDDFAGRLYESTVAENDAVYIHKGGAYALEVRDSDDEIGAYRVNPATEDSSEIHIDRPETGTAVLSEFVADIAEETRQAVATYREESTVDPSTDVAGLERALEAVTEAARKAAERARNDERGRADSQLGTVAERLQRVESRLTEVAEGLPPSLSKAAGHRMEQASRRTDQAQTAEKL
ncbi:MAG: hypothetical protein ACOCTH_01465 [Halodesulfurarchaeum sp.]